MPLYEYQCKKCHSLTERIQKFSDPLEQLISAAAVRFKGSGWYVTDYAKKSSTGRSANGNGSSSSSSAESKSETSKTEGPASSESSSEKTSSEKPSSEKSSSVSDKSTGKK